jgi:hypothetical protein
MASVARFGFEGGLVPSNVQILSASFVPGRNGGTALEGSASGVFDGNGTVDRNSNVSVSSISTNNIFYSCQIKRVSANSNVAMNLVQFGGVWVEYVPASSQVVFKKGKLTSPGYDVLYTSPATVVFPIDTWIPISGKFTISSTVGEISITIDGSSYSATTLNTVPTTMLAVTATSMTEVFVPPTTQWMNISVSGAGGGGSINSGGSGGYVGGNLNVKFGQRYWAVAGGGGIDVNSGRAGGTPGGGNGGNGAVLNQSGGGGGGYTGIFTSSIASTSSAVIVAGGGGGGSYSTAGTAGGNAAANYSPLSGGSGASNGSMGGGGGGGGYIGGAGGTVQLGGAGGSNFARSDLTSVVASQGGGSAGGLGPFNPGTAGRVSITSSYDTTTITFGIGVNRNNTVVGTPTFQLDDVSVNNGYTSTNSTGSFGVSDASIPSFISCKLVPYSATGSNTSGWNLPGGNIISSIGNTGSSGQYLTASFYPRPVLELAPSNVVSGVSTVEGINLYFSGSYREGSSNAYIVPHFMLNDTSSVSGHNSFLLSSFQRTGSVSIFEKDLGGKLSYNEFLNGKISLDSTQWINKNFFGRGTFGDVRFSSSYNFTGPNPGNQDEYVILEYNNLIIDSGVTLSVATQKRGLVIYVKENCIINGTISMDGGTKGSSGSLAGGFVFNKNVSTSSFSEYSSSISSLQTIPQEQIFQPVYSGQSTELGISGSFAVGGNGSSWYLDPGATGASGSFRNCGGGGGGGQGGGGSGGNGNTGGSYSGGSGGGGGGNGGTGLSALALAGSPGNGGGGGSPGGAGARGGGVIYLIVGGTLTNTGIISANGGNGGSAGTSAGGGGGGGGGSVNIMYGRNIINAGTIRANGGTGGTAGQTAGGPGGAGSVTITKILTN